ncbi:MAG: MarC family protein [Crenarchaeota archaeon]|nr:MarC family protein [Thermoproteota archaeon]
MISEAVVNAFIALLIIIDPFTNAPIFYQMTASFDPRQRKRIIVRSVIVSTFILLLFALFGDTIVKPFGMTVDDIRIATGLILLIYAIQALFGKSEAEMIDPESIAIVPMAIPMLAGPGAISLVLYYRSVMPPHEVGLVVVAVMLVSLPILLAGRYLDKLLGKNGTLALTRILAILMAGLGIAMIREGVAHITS